MVMVRFVSQTSKGGLDCILHSFPEHLNADIVCIMLNGDLDEYVRYQNPFSNDELAYDMIEK